MPSPFDIASLTVDAVTWTPFTAVCTAEKITLEAPASTDVKLRLTAEDATKEITIYAGNSLPLRIGAQNGFLFSPGDVIGYLQSTSGTVAVKILYERYVS